MTTFVPAPGLGGRHLQTIWLPLLRRPAALPLVRERMELADGDFLDLDRLPGPAGAPTLLVLHGLEGSSAAGYVRGMLAQAQARGWRGVGLNFRSCSGEPNRLARSYHSGETGDLGLVVDKLRGEEARGPLLLAGVSLGGNVLVKWLGEQGERARELVAAAAAISVPFELSRCADALDAPDLWARMYRARFLRTLLAKARERAQRFPGALDAAKLGRIRTLREFDEQVTARLHGFSSAADYYARCSSAPFVARVRVPLLLISAEDDPFIPREALPREAASANPLVQLEVSARGGHVGFVAGSLLRPRAWAEERALAFLANR